MHALSASAVDTFVYSDKGGKGCISLPGFNLVECFVFIGIVMDVEVRLLNLLVRLVPYVFSSSSIALLMDCVLNQVVGVVPCIAGEMFTTFP